MTRPKHDRERCCGRGRRTRLRPGVRSCCVLLKNPRKTGQVVECLWDEEAGVANRAADALERLRAGDRRFWRSWKEALLAGCSMLARTSCAGTWR